MQAPPLQRQSTSTAARAVLTREDGAFDLPSILVGVVTVGILTAGVLASIFGIIPYAQDKGAQQDAAAVRTAEGVAKAKDGKFMDTAGLISAGYLSIPSASAAEPIGDSASGLVRSASTTPALKYAVATDPTGTCFLVVSHSDSGTLFYQSSDASDPKVLGATDVPPCVTETQLRSLIDSAGGDSSKRGPAAPVLAADPIAANGYANVTWAAVPGATGYKVSTSLNGGDWTDYTPQQIDTQYGRGLLASDTWSIRVTTVTATSESAPSTLTVHRPGYMNVFTNSGFEDGTNGWTLTGGGATAKTEPWISGEGNLLVQDSTPGFTLSQVAAVQPGQQLNVTMRYQNRVSANGAVRFYDANHNEIPGSSVPWTFVHTDYPVFGSFASGTTVPAGAVSASVTITTADDYGLTLLDDVQLNVFK
jgi:hypothetical protein